MSTDPSPDDRDDELRDHEGEPDNIGPPNPLPSEQPAGHAGMPPLPRAGKIADLGEGVLKTPNGTKIKKLAAKPLPRQIVSAIIEETYCAKGYFSFCLMLLLHPAWLKLTSLHEILCRFGTQCNFARKCIRPLGYNLIAGSKNRPNRHPKGTQVFQCISDRKLKGPRVEIAQLRLVDLIKGAQDAHCKGMHNKAVLLALEALTLFPLSFRANFIVAAGVFLYGVCIPQERLLPSARFMADRWSTMKLAIRVLDRLLRQEQKPDQWTVVIQAIEEWRTELHEYAPLYRRCRQFIRHGPSKRVLRPVTDSLEPLFRSLRGASPHEAEASEQIAELCDHTPFKLLFYKLQRELCDPISGLPQFNAKDFRGAVLQELQSKDVESLADFLKVADERVEIRLVNLIEKRSRGPEHLCGDMDF